MESTTARKKYIELTITTFYTKGIVFYYSKIKEYNFKQISKGSFEKIVKEVREFRNLHNNITFLRQLLITAFKEITSYFIILKVVNKVY